MTAQVYDIEVFPNVFTLSACPLGEPQNMTTWELSRRRNDIPALIDWFNWLNTWQIEMWGYNNIGYDYNLIHMIYMLGGRVTTADLYQKSMSIILSQDRFGQTVYQSERFAPQVDLYKIHHFDNQAKRQSLKGLEFNMRSETVQDMPVALNTYLTDEQIDKYLIPYNQHDVRETNRFGVITTPNITFRRAMASKLTGDVLNFNDTKIGKQIFEQRLGDELCFDRSSGRKVPRQTIRASIPLGPIIFPYISFDHQELNRVLNWMRETTIVGTKDVFPDVQATIADTMGRPFTLHYGTGGIHGSVDRRAIIADADYAVCDIDVAALYPSIGIVNRLFPAHLGEKFVEVWASIVGERKQYSKGTPENASLKLAGNGPYGDSANDFSPLLDRQFTMSITINGQLMLSMLAERLARVPTLELIQVNTDGITFRVHRAWEWQTKIICAEWEKLTRLTLEWAHYSRMFIRDVNNYVAEPVTAGKALKSKGAYEWFKDAAAISNASPSAWHKDLSSPVVQMAAEAAMIKGVDPVAFIWSHSDPFDFCIRAKVDRSSQLFIGEKQVQRITRYFIARNGAPMRKVSPPTGRPGTYKRKPGISDADYYAWIKAWGADTWSPDVNTANKSVHAEREIGINAGWLVAECNHIADFDWNNLNRDWYIQETRKLIIA